MNEVEAPMMASGKNAKRSRSAAPVVSRSQGLPWLTIGAVVVVLLLVGGIFTVVYSKHKSNSDAAAAVAPFVPSAADKDPSTKISGIYAGKSTVASNGTLSFTEYKAALHVAASQRVAYDRFPPIGGPHDAEWADCNGDVYTVAVRNESMVHPLEHGAVWITYNPKTIASGDLDKLKALVTAKTYLFMSPYPDLDSPISLQAWAHQLKVPSADDIRIKQFITALQQNTYIAPEPGGNCDQPGFAANPPAFVATAPGTGAIQMNGAGLTAVTTEGVANPGGTAAPSPGAAVGGSGGATAAAVPAPASPAVGSSVASSGK